MDTVEREDNETEESCVCACVHVCVLTLSVTCRLPSWREFNYLN